MSMKWWHRPRDIGGRAPRHIDEFPNMKGENPRRKLRNGLGGMSTTRLSSANVRRKLGKLVEYLVYMNHSETRRIHGRRSHVESLSESFHPSLEIVLRATREDLSDSIFGSQ